MVLSKKGFTLIELLLVITIIIIMVMLSVMALNPAMLKGRAQDARRKKDLNRIRVAFEEYFNDKGCYPDQTLVNGLTCGGSEFSPWLQPWPCDPFGTPYKIYTGSGCPTSFVALANLYNKKDKAILTDWYTQNDKYIYGDGTLTADEVNYGISSTNVNWYNKTMIDISQCNTVFGDCFLDYGSGCQALSRNDVHNNAYIDNNCKPGCQVSCCLNGAICN